ncbi:MAG: prepilin peptidase [Thermodesulfobacteriota bacterium]|nr:prepilin peptidase [Thermodesulfobacteriota bacterium]
MRGPLASIFFIVLGACIGSFLNVCIYRISEGKSIIFPKSFCPNCQQPIRLYDNIPIISYLVLRGRCRNCHKKISLRYPVVELITALLSLLLFWKYGFSFQYLFAFVFTCALIIITFIDLDHQIIPDVITLPGIPLFFLLTFFFMNVSFLDSILGVLIGGGGFYLIAVVYQLVTKREGMGGGDIKLIAMLGAFLGWKSLLFILIVSSFLGAITGVSMMIIHGKDLKYAVPFGPFLSIAAVAYIFFGDYFMNFLILRHGIY